MNYFCFIEFGIHWNPSNPWTSPELNDLKATETCRFVVQDRPRTEAYQKAIMENASVFRDKTGRESFINY